MRVHVISDMEGVAGIVNWQQTTGGEALPPCQIRVEFKHTKEPDRLRFRPGVERVDDRTIVSRAETWWDARRQFYF